MIYDVNYLMRFFSVVEVDGDVVAIHIGITDVSRHYTSNTRRMTQKIEDAEKNVKEQSRLQRFDAHFK